MSFFYLAAAGFAAALLVTGWATPLVRRLALTMTWTDRPDGTRKLHAVPTPSAGGLAIVAGVIVSLGLLSVVAPLVGLPFPDLPLFVYVGALLMVGVGAMDDIRGLGFKPKLLVECIVAYGLLHAGYRIDLSFLPFVGSDVYIGALYSVPLTVLWIVGVINAVNLIDGVDGLAAGTSAIALAALAFVFGLHGDFPIVLVAVAVIGALVGFLIYNFNPASIFMGDSGSLFLGYVLAVYALSGPTQVHPGVATLVPLLALGLPLLDTTVSMARRLAERRAIFAPDCDHIHHRMVQRFKTRRAVLTLYVVAAVFGASAVAVSQATFGMALWITGATLAAALGFVSMLGYVRRPYVQPTLSLIGDGRPDRRLATDASTDRPPTGGLPAPDAPPSTGDGASPPAIVGGRPDRPWSDRPRRLAPST